MKPATRSIGSILAGRRVAARLTQEQLRGELGVSTERVSNIECNKGSAISVPLFLAWCKACEAAPEAVLAEVIETNGAA
jgi:transcriptional regulator with XRE-family HTH domain